MRAKINGKNREVNKKKRKGPSKSRPRNEKQIMRIK
jgi:hypothetical protein